MISFSLPYAGTTQIRFKGYFSVKDIFSICDTPSGCVLSGRHGQDYATFLDNDQLIRFLVSIDVVIDF